MRTNIDINDNLLAQAMKDSGAATKKEAVEIALQFFVDVKGQGEIRKLRGMAQWEGDLNESRQSRFPDLDIDIDLKKFK